MTLASVTRTITAELRYSAACNAVWAKATGTDNTYEAWVYGLTVEEPQGLGDGDPIVFMTPGAEPGGTFSAMISFDRWVRVCVFGQGTTDPCTEQFNSSMPQPLPEPAPEPAPEPTPEPEPAPEPSPTPEPGPEPAPEPEPEPEVPGGPEPTVDAPTDVVPEQTTLTTAMPTTDRPPDSPGGFLPTTGSTTIPVAVVGATLVAVGVGLVLLRRLRLG